MRRVRVKVQRTRAFNGDASFEVFGDLGTGTIDYDHPLSPRPIALWPEASPRSGHVRDGHLTLRHLDGACGDGHVDAGHVASDHLQPALDVIYDTPAYVFGRFQHAVVMRDAAGNTSSPTVAAITINSAPTVPQCLARNSYNAVTDQITFSFEPSRFQPISGK